MDVPGLFDSDVEAALARDEFGRRFVCVLLCALSSVML